MATRWIELRRENWDHCPPASVSSDNCAIFGLNPFDPEETYLVWGEVDPEPMIWRYTGADYKVFKNLNRFLQYILGDLTTDDSARWA